MCAITGLWSRHQDPSIATLQAMAAAMAHRGPDDAGAWVDAGTGLGLGHRRLAIVDLSPAGRQPMLSHEGRYALVYNGEIYNHAEVRAEIEAQRGGGIAWRGHSDTETLLEACALWGLQAALRRCVGMFALALWDRQTRVLQLARDRLGEKPLYHGRSAGGDLVFASELKAFAALPSGWAPEIDRTAIAQYMRYSYIPAPRSIYRSIHKLAPGSIARYAGVGAEPVITRYWDFQAAIDAARTKPFTGSLPDAADELERMLAHTIRFQSLADVPLGAFLSGGIDSSTVVALMQKHSGAPVRSFSIGFHDDAYNEAEHAAAVARHLGTQHTELYVSADEARSIIPKLATMFDEPFGDSSQIPTWLVSRMARRDVTVSLSGDGGDELFGGYRRYQDAPALWQRLLRIPSGLRSGLGRVVRGLEPATWSSLMRPLAPVLPARHRYADPGDKLHKLADTLSLGSQQAVYDRLMGQWPLEVALDAPRPSAPLGDAAWQHAANAEDAMMAADTLSYLPDDILVKVDRASMAVSLESRVPLLDHRIVEFAWSLPASMRLHEGVGKRVLREVLARHVPRSLTDRPKMGFSIPVDAWLRGPLRSWADALLDPDRMRADGFLDAGMVRRRWQEHLSGDRNWQYAIWHALMFQAWREQWLPGASVRH